jgi:hypothetical protein
VNRLARVRWTPSQRRAVRDGLVIAGVLLTLAQLGLAFLGYNDAVTYWQTDPNDLYRGWVPGQPGYGYAPTFALLMAPFRLIPLPVYRLIYLALTLLALWWLARPVSSFWKPAFVVLCLPEVVNGNLYLFIACALALLPERAWTWPVVILIKVTPSVALAWHVGRRDWRGLVVAGVATLAVVAVSVGLQGPEIWARWLDNLWSNREAASITVAALPPAILRAALAGVVALWAGWRNWRPGIAVAVVLATPAFVLTALTVLAAWPRLAARRPGEAANLAPVSTPPAPAPATAPTGS